MLWVPGESQASDMTDKKPTKQAIDNPHASGTDACLCDTSPTGFGVRARPSGAKTFILTYRSGGGRSARKQRYSIGKHGTLTLVSQCDVVWKRGVQPTSCRLFALRCRVPPPCTGGSSRPPVLHVCSLFGQHPDHERMAGLRKKSPPLQASRRGWNGEGSMKKLIIAVAATIALSACAEPSERLDHQQWKVARCMDTGTKSLTECRAWAAAN